MSRTGNVRRNSYRQNQSHRYDQEQHPQTISNQGVGDEQAEALSSRHNHYPSSYYSQEGQRAQPAMQHYTFPPPSSDSTHHFAESHVISSNYEYYRAPGGPYQSSYGSEYYQGSQPGSSYYQYPPSSGYPGPSYNSDYSAYNSAQDHGSMPAYPTHRPRQPRDAANSSYAGPIGETGSFEAPTSNTYMPYSFFQPYPLQQGRTNLSASRSRPEEGAPDASYQHRQPMQYAPHHSQHQNFLYTPESNSPNSITNAGPLPPSQYFTSFFQHQHQEQQRSMKYINQVHPDPFEELPQKEVPTKKANKIKKRKKAKDGKPKRPLSAYNLFFQDERAKMLQQIGPPKVDTTLITGNDTGTDTKELGSRSTGSKKKRTGIGFAAMAKSISCKWKSIDRETLAIYKERADADMKRYRAAMEKFCGKKAGEEVDDGTQEKGKLDADVPNEEAMPEEDSIEEEVVVDAIDDQEKLDGDAVAVPDDARAVLDETDSMGGDALPDEGHHSSKSMVNDNEEGFELAGGGQT